MKQRKIPMRKCVVSQEMMAKKQLIRVVRTPENQIEINLTGKRSGRGAYLTATPEMVDLAQKKKALERALKVTIPIEIYDHLREVVGRVQHDE